MADEQNFAAQAPSAGVGPRLRAAREAGGYTLEQMANLTKIPARMLTLIEAGNFAALPARTYATGFTRTYARVLGLDEKAYVAAVRDELGMHREVEPKLTSAYEPGDPARVPTARFAWLAAVAALVVIAVGLFFWRTFYAPAVTLPPLDEPTASVAPAVLPPPVAMPTVAPGATGAADAGLLPGTVPTGAALPAGQVFGQNPAQNSVQLQGQARSAAPAPAAPAHSAPRRAASAPAANPAGSGAQSGAQPAAPAPASTAQ